MQAVDIAAAAAAVIAMDEVRRFLRVENLFEEISLLICAREDSPRALTPLDLSVYFNRMWYAFKSFYWLL